MGIKCGADGAPLGGEVPASKFPPPFPAKILREWHKDEIKMERTVIAVSSMAEASAFEGTDQSATRRKPKPQMDQPYKPPQRRNDTKTSDNKNIAEASSSSGETPGARADRAARGVPTPQRLFADSPSFNPGGQEARQPRNADVPQQQRQQHQQQGLEEQLDKLSLSGGPRDAKQHGRHSGGNNRREGANARSENKSSQGRKPKNTECFDPDARTDMRMVFGRSNKKNLREDRGEYHVKDVVMVPSLFCEEEDMDVYNALLAELRSACPEGGPEAGLSLAKGRDGLWATWHGDTHVIADDKKMGGKWKALSPSFAKVVDRMAEYFDMDVKATRLNWWVTPRRQPLFNPLPRHISLPF